ncbi:MAG: radical SAM protein [Candidatus Thiodiazotropha sp. (ex. Lucinoma kazani)]
MTTPITLYLKLTNGCPLSCSHCYLPESARKDHRVLGVDAMEEGILNLLKGNNRNRPVNVILHGGEPLLPGYINLKERIETIEALLGDRLIGWSIQSSLVGLTRQIIELLAEHQFHVGTSYDNFRFQRHPNLLEHWGIQVALLRGAGFVPGVSWTPGRGDDPHVVAEAFESVAIS